MVSVRDATNESAKVRVQVDVNPTANESVDIVAGNVAVHASAVQVEFKLGLN